MLNRRSAVCCAIFHLLFSIFVSTAIGCSSQVGTDSHTEVFQTAQEAAEGRRKRLMSDWQELAAKIANAERPDVKTRKAAEGFGLVMAADGVEQAVDLSPLAETLSSANGREREPIRKYLAEKFPELDRARLKALGFEKVRPMLMPHLVNGKQAKEMAGTVVNPVVIDLNWAPVVRWRDGGGAQSPVAREVVTAWGVSEAEVNQAAMANLTTEVEGTPTLFETTELPGLGRYGMMRAGVDPVVALSPVFLKRVREVWKTGGDVVVFMPSRTSVTLLEEGNKRLVDRMVPEWQKVYAKVTEPLMTNAVVVGDGGLSLFSYKPPEAVTKPATVPSTKPTGYIVR